MSAPTAQRLLIFGGTFDPPHRAHIELPVVAARELDCDRILYVPAAINPLKTAPDMAPAPARDRLAMLRLALEVVPNAGVSTIELDRAGPSYTVDTLRSLASERLPGSTFLLIGADQALDFHRWKEWREILRLARPAVIPRVPWSPSRLAAALRERYDEREARLWEGWMLRTAPIIEISASDIRQRVREGRALADLVSPPVEAYIREHHLYRA